MGPFAFGAAAADEPIVFGAQRPGFDAPCVGPPAVAAWLHFMQQHAIRRVVCLLTDAELGFYPSLPGGLLGAYAATFGADRVFHHPLPDFQLCAAEPLHAILARLRAADAAGERVVVHCSAGVGRTGQVLAAWLIQGRGLSAAVAIQTVLATGRNPRGPVAGGIASEADLLRVLAGCRPPASPL